MKMRYFGICILLAAILLCMALPVQAAFAESTPVLLLSGKTEGDEIVVTVTLRNNDGISTMLLNLEYDRDRLTLLDCQRGSALADLDLIPSGNYNVYPYVLTWSGDDNDSSVGTLLTLRFAAKEGANGQAFVKFSYGRDKDINYFEGGELMTRNMLTDTLRIDLSEGEAITITTEHPEAEERVKEDKKKNTAMVVGLAVGGAVAIVLIVAVPWFVVRKKRG